MQRAAGCPHASPADRWFGTPTRCSGGRCLAGGLSGLGRGSAAPSVFIVGDPKAESIYRFRRAGPQDLSPQAFIREGLGGDLLAATTPDAMRAGRDWSTPSWQAAQAEHHADFRDHTTDAQDGPGCCALPPSADARRCGMMPMPGQTHWPGATA